MRAQVMKAANFNMVIFSLSLLLSFASMAKAPIFEEGPVKTINDTNPGGETQRLPAQSAGLPAPLDKYLDMDCHELVNPKSSDDFIRYFTSQVKELNDGFCSIVGESAPMEEFDMAQSESRMIGMGTFSKLLEGHYNEFSFNKKLEYYQDLDCLSMMDGESKDEFIRFFSERMTEINDNMCASLALDGDVNEDDDFAQASRPIGQGTWSKLIEESYLEFNYRQ